MAKISFWSEIHGQGGNTSNVVATAALIGLEYSLKTLVTHTQWSHSTLEGSFFRSGNIDDNNLLNFSDSGIDALERLARTNRLSPESIRDYTEPIIKDRLDLLVGTTKPDISLYEKINDVVESIFAAAKRYYNVLLLDVHSGYKNKLTNTILNESDLIVVCLNQNVRVLDRFFSQEQWPEALHNKPFVVLLGQYDPNSKYTIKNIARRYKTKVPIYSVPYCSEFKDACNDQNALEFFMRLRRYGKGHENYFFVSELRRFTLAILKQIGVDTELAFIERGAS